MFCYRTSNSITGQTPGVLFLIRRSFFVIYSSELQGCKRIGTCKKYANVFNCKSDVFQNAHTFYWKAFLRKFHLILFFWFMGMVLILNQVPSFTDVFNQLWPKNSKTMVTIPFFRNLDRWDLLPIKSTYMPPNRLKASNVHLNLTAGKKGRRFRSHPRTS